MGPGQCAGPEQMCPGTTGAPICETNWPTFEKLEQLQQALRRKGQLAVANPVPLWVQPTTGWTGQPPSGTTHFGNEAFWIAGK